MTLLSGYKRVSRRPASDGVGQTPVNGDTLSDEICLNMIIISIPGSDLNAAGLMCSKHQHKLAALTTVFPLLFFIIYNKAIHLPYLFLAPFDSVLILHKNQIKGRECSTIPLSSNQF